MFYWINQLLRELAWSVLGLTDSAMLRGFIALLPILMVYAIPVFFIKSASNYYKVHKEETGTVWLRITKILFCIDGAWVVVFVHKFPYAKYPVGLTILEIILSAVMLFLIMANSDAKIKTKLRLFLDTFILGKRDIMAARDINNSVYCCLFQHTSFIRAQRRSRFAKISVSTFICHFMN